MKQSLRYLILLGAAACWHAGLAQTSPETILEIDVENSVIYRYDTLDASKLATDASLTVTGGSVRNFQFFSGVADIVAVNGKPAKGTLIERRAVISLSPQPSLPGQGIGDTVRAGVREVHLDILQADGTPVGTIVTSGLFGGPVSPGSPLARTNSASAITGGTGAFLGVRGQQVGRPAAPGVPGPRTALVTEDPANRRVHGGGKATLVLHLIPMFRPEIGAVTHSSDFSQVTTAKPASLGEILSLFATGLGPTGPGVDPGIPFPTSPVQVVNSPIEVTVNGRSAEVVGAVGFPGSLDGYQVNFRVPPETERGLAIVRVSAAWISGPEVKVAVQ